MRRHNMPRPPEVLRKSGAHRLFERWIEVCDPYECPRGPHCGGCYGSVPGCEFGR